jgi:hypothetical protein
MVFSALFGYPSVNVNLILFSGGEEVMCLFKIELKVMITQLVVREFVYLIVENSSREVN